MQMCGGFSILTSVSVIGSFFISTCLYAIAFIDSWQLILKHLDEAITEDPTLTLNREKFNKNIIRTIAYHTEIYK